MNSSDGKSGESSKEASESFVVTGVKLLFLGALIGVSLGTAFGFGYRAFMWAAGL